MANPASFEKQHPTRDRLVHRRNAARELSSGKTFLTFAGTETYLLFQQGYTLRDFCAFEVLRDDRAWQRTESELLEPIAAAARAGGHGLISDCLVWRASPDYVAKLGYSRDDVTRLNREAASRVGDFLRRAADDPAIGPLVLAADLGPRGDGYALLPGQALSVEAARAYHAPQLEALASTDVAVVFALTMTHVAEAAGLALAARDQGLPVVISATVETDGKLPDQSSLGAFIQRVDEATDGYPVHYMVNCAHPTHLEPALEAARARGERWLSRFKGLRANASTKSHQELDQSTELDAGDAADLGARVAALRDRYELTAVGGCCGTDARHLAAISAACARR